MGWLCLLLEFVRIDEAEFTVVLADFSVKRIGVIIPFVFRFIWSWLLVGDFDEVWRTRREEAPSCRRTTI